MCDSSLQFTQISDDNQPETEAWINLISIFNIIQLHYIGIVIILLIVWYLGFNCRRYSLQIDEDMRLWVVQRTSE